MSRSPAISGTLLIFALCIVIEISSAPRERLDDSWKQEKFLQTREAELLELTRVARDEKSHESREHEIERRMAKEPLPPTPKKKSAEQDTTKKSAIDDKPKDDATSKPAVSEAKDMTQTHVSPKDDDDDSSPVPTSSKVPEGTEKNSSTNKTTTDLAHNVPEGDKGNTPNATIDGHSSAVDSEGKTTITTDQPNKVETSNGTSASTVPTSTIPPSTTVVTPAPAVTSSTASTAITISTSATVTEATTTSTSAATTESTTSEKPTTAKSDTTPSTNAPTEATTPTTTTTQTSVSMTTSSSTKSEPITDNPMTPSSTEMSEAEKLLHSKPAPPPTSMPSGVVALITAIAFAIVAVIAYIGLVVWRRYLEWRYGNRELLVNEFDSNDIGNFEL